MPEWETTSTEIALDVPQTRRYRFATRRGMHMFNFLKKRVFSDDLANSLAVAATESAVMSREHIDYIVRDSGAERSAVEREFVFLATYWIESAIQTIVGEGAPEALLTQFRARVHSSNPRLWDDYHDRVRRYDLAFTSGSGIEFARAFVQFCGAPEDLGNLLIGAPIAASFGVTLLPRLRKMRIVDRLTQMRVASD